MSLTSRCLSSSDKRVGRRNLHQVYLGTYMVTFDPRGSRSSRTSPQAKTILAKYLKSGHPMIETTLQWVREGRSVVVEITPAYFTSWDYGKLQQGSRNDMLGAVQS